jgi:hypothetical protein
MDDNAAFLEKQGFTCAQLYHGVELLFYPLRYIQGRKKSGTGLCNFISLEAFAFSRK